MKKFRFLALLVALLLVLSSLTSCFRRPLIDIDIGSGGGNDTNKIKQEDKKDTNGQKEEENKDEEEDDSNHGESGGN